MKKETKRIFLLFARYLFMILIALPNLYLFYLIFTPATVYFIYYILNSFLEVTLFKSIFIFNGFSVEIIPACVAGAAYYFLLALNLAVPKIRPKKRLYMVGFAFASLFIFNVLRILVLMLVLSLSYSAGSLALFDLIHQGFWYAMNVLVVVAIWFAEVKIFNVKEIPVYNDIKFLYKKSLFSKSKKSKAKHQKSKKRN
ncbi:pacearchaeosortase [Candidatus Pacearchaeota archaeon]|nr:pacearchaeosortase [Candidatus Pacearchaeota archaeon]